MMVANNQRNFYYLLDRRDCLNCFSTRLKKVRGIYKLDTKNNVFIPDELFNNNRSRKLFNIGLSNIVNCYNCSKLFNIFNISYDSILPHKKRKGFISGPFGVGIDNFALYDYTTKEREAYFNSLARRLEMCFRYWRKHYMNPSYFKIIIKLINDVNNKKIKSLKDLKELTYFIVEFICNVRKAVFNENVFISILENLDSEKKEEIENSITFCSFSEFKENSGNLDRFFAESDDPDIGPAQSVQLQIYAPGQSKQSEFNLELIRGDDNIIVFFECQHGLKIIKTTDFQPARAAFLNYHNEIIFPQIKIKNKNKFILINEIILWKLAWSSIFQSTFCLW